MPITYEIDVPNRRVRTIFSGVVTFEEMRATVAASLQDPLFDPAYSQLVDLTLVTALKLSYSELETFRRTLDPFSMRARRAVVAPTDVSFGIARMYEIILDSASFSVFHTMEEALRWLDSK